MRKIVFLLLLLISSVVGQLPQLQNHLIQHKYYTLNYNEQHEQADWVMYKLSPAMLKNRVVDRKDCFRMDKMVRSKSASSSDYSKSGYDKGHLCPSADMLFDSIAMVETFFMSNMSPQKPYFNRGIWKKLEGFTRNYVMVQDGVYVVTGPILTNNLNTIGKNKVSIPNYYYKILVDNDMDKAIGFLMKNEKTSLPLDSFVVSIDSLEKLTGMDFFSIHEEIESRRGNIIRWK